MKRLAAALQIRPGEGYLAALVAALFAMVEAGRGLGANAADALFFKRYGVENLPTMYLLLGAASLLVAVGYTAALGRFAKRRFYAALFLVLPAILLIERTALGLDAPALYPVLWLTVYVIATVLGVLTWNIAGDVCDARQAKRLFSLFVSAAILGGVAGNFITGPAANWLGTENLLLLDAALLLACFVVVRATARRFVRVEAKRGQRASFLKDARVGYDYVRRSRLFGLLAVASVLFSILYFSMAYPFSQAASAAFPDEAELAGFLGVFAGIVTAVTFLVSLFGANRLYARIGLVNAILILPVTYLIGFVVFAASSALTAAVAARAAQLIVLGGLGGSAWGTLFNAVPAERRSQVSTFENGILSQVGVALGGVLLILGGRVLTTAQIFAMGMIVAVLCAAIVWRMRRAYADALVDALRAGRYEVFGAGERALAGFRGDAAAIQIACTALSDDKPAMRRLAAHMLARIGARSSTPWLIEALRDPDAEVRVAVIDALDALGAADAAGDLVLLLGDSQAQVRAHAVHALARLQSQVAPAVADTVDRLLRDPDVNVRAQAAVALAKFGRVSQGLPTLEALLRDPDSDVRCRALGALEELADSGHRVFSLALVLGALEDGASAVRRAACRALGATQDESAVAPLIGRLGNADASVRSAAAESLRSFGARATDAILNVLRGDDTRAQDAALQALNPGDPRLADALPEYAHREIARAQAWRHLAVAIPRAGRVTQLLRDTLESRAAGSEQRLVHAVGLLGHRDVMDLVGRSLAARDAETRAAAIEALELLGDKHLAREIIPLLDAAPDAAGLTTPDALAQLLDQSDGWLRALAARAVAEVQLRALSARVESLLRDGDPVVQQSARDALRQLKEAAPMETLPTVSVMERILLLREVPLFADLAPDDLKQIADVASEHVYSDGAVICREGEDGDRMFVIAAGRVSVLKRADGGEKRLATRQVGDFLGEMSIIESAPRFASVRAEGDVRLLALDGQAFKAILRDRPEVSLAVLRGLSRRLRERE